MAASPGGGALQAAPAPLRQPQRCAWHVLAGARAGASRAAALPLPPLTAPPPPPPACRPSPKQQQQQPASQPAMAGAEWVAGLTVAQLKEELRTRGQAVSGKKAELAARLTEHLEQNPEVRGCLLLLLPLLPWR